MLFTVDEWKDDKTVYAKSLVDMMFGVAVIAMLLMAGFAVAGFLGAPLVVLAILNGLFVGSFVMLTGIGYGILNDLFACRNNLEYFRFGHNPGQHRGLVKHTLDPNAHAVAWGFLGTFGLALLAGIVFAIFTGLTFHAGLLFSPLALGILLAGGASCAVLAHLISTWTMWVRNRLPASDPLWGNMEEHLYDISSWEYKPHLAKMSPEQKKDFINSWLGNNDRNLTGYIMLPALAITMLALMKTVPVLHIGVAAFAASLPLQVALAGALTACILFGIGYFYFRVHQVKANVKPREKVQRVAARPAQKTDELHKWLGLVPKPSPQVVTDTGMSGGEPTGMPDAEGRTVLDATGGHRSTLVVGEGSAGQGGSIGFGVSALTVLGSGDSPLSPAEDDLSGQRSLDQ